MKPVLLLSCAAALAAAPAFAQPANDLCSGAQVITAAQIYPGTNLGAISDIAQTCSTRDAIDVWYRFTATQAGQHAISVRSPNFLLDTTLAVYSGSCTGPRIACNDDADPFYGTDSLVLFSLESGQQIAIRVGGYDFGEGPFTILIVPPASPPLTGACCIGTLCTITPSPTNGGCLATGARFAGSGSACNAVGNTSFPCCLADFDQNGALTISDLFNFLNAWFTANPLAQFHNAAGMTTQNILDFLAAWYGGC